MKINHLAITYIFKKLKMLKMHTIILSIDDNSKINCISNLTLYIKYFGFLLKHNHNKWFDNWIRLYAIYYEVKYTIDFFIDFLVPKNLKYDYKLKNIFSLLFKYV